MTAQPTETERTPRGQGELLRERLVDAALEMIDEQGDASQASIRAVTRRAGVSPTAFYLHFEHRDELLRACIERSFVDFRDAVREGSAGVAGPAERLHRAGLAYVRFARERPARYALIFGAALPGASADGVEPRGKPPAGADAFGDLVTAVLDNLPADDPRRDEAETLAKGIWSGLHGFVTLCRSRPGMEWPSDEEFIARLARAWLAGA